MIAVKYIGFGKILDRISKYVVRVHDDWKQKKKLWFYEWYSKCLDQRK
jgi:hypothetical protein